MRSAKSALSLLLLSLALFATTDTASAAPGGSWKVVGNSGVAAMHIVVTHPTRILIIDKAEKNIVKTADGESAHSVEYNLQTNKFRVLNLDSNTFCSAGAFLGNGTLVETGGAEETYGQQKAANGFQSLRLFHPCTNNKCDWIEFPKYLTSARWYNSMTTLPDGRVFILGGSTKSAAVNAVAIQNPTYEFYPGDRDPPGVPFQFLLDTFPYNLYPVVHVVPPTPNNPSNSLLYMFANTKSILWDFKTKKVQRTYKNIAGPPRSYPLTGSAVLLPLSYENDYAAEFMVCGGNSGMTNTLTASNTCGRLRITDKNPTWEMEDFGGQGRVMSDAVILADGKILFLNGAAKGYAGYDKTNKKTGVTTNLAQNPVLFPVLYDPKAQKGKRWTKLAPSAIPRMYHSVATLVPDGRVFVTGSNPNENFKTNSKFPTELRVEMFTPPYLQTNTPRPTITKLAGSQNLNAADPIKVNYKTDYDVVVTLPAGSPAPKYSAALVHYGFVTHSQHMSQRYVKLSVSNIRKDGDTYTISVKTPPNSSVMPPGKVYMYILNNGVPCTTAVEVML